MWKEGLDDKRPQRRERRDFSRQPAPIAKDVNEAVLNVLSLVEFPAERRPHE